MATLKLKSVVAAWFSWVKSDFLIWWDDHPLNMAEDKSSMELTDFEAGLLGWLCENNFHAEPWSTTKSGETILR
jgi:hypothetical protein